MDEARQACRKLTALEMAGVAGAWARSAPMPDTHDCTDPEAAAVVLEALQEAQAWASPWIPCKGQQPRPAWCSSH